MSYHQYILSRETGDRRGAAAALRRARIAERNARQRAWNRFREFRRRYSYAREFPIVERNMFSGNFAAAEHTMDYVERRLVRLVQQNFGLN